MTLELFVLICSTAIGLIVGLLVFAKNPRSFISQVYGIMSACLIAYPIFNYFSLQTDDRLLLIRLVIFFATLSVAFQYSLVWLIAESKTKFDTLRKRILFVSALVAILDLTPLVFKGLTSPPDPTPIPSIAAPIFIVHFVLMISLAVIKLFKSYRVESGMKKNQIFILLIGLLPIVILSPITSFLLPVLFENSSLIFLSPVYGAFFVLTVGYAIVKHRLFDIKLVVVRSLAYIFTLAILSLVYGFIASLVSNSLSVTLQSSSFASISFSAATLSLAAVSYGPLKRQFDKLSNKLFYRDAYDPQAFLDQLNKELVSTVDLESLLNRCAEIIDENIKSQYCLFGLKETAYSPQRVIGTANKKFDSDDIQKVRAITPHMGRTVFISDELEDNSELKQALQKYDIAVLGRLASDTHLEIEGLGYLILGSKKSGNPYNKQDLRMINIILNELVIAIQNALRFEEIEKFNITLQDKVDSATAELQRTNAKLQEIDETKDEFISMASHQLRTPLTSVKGYLSMILEGDVGKVNKKQVKMLEQAFLSSQRMVYLIADLLNVSRLKTGKFVIDPKETNLADVVETEVEQILPSAKARDLKLTFKKPTNFPVLMLDETKIRQVVMNFIDNAIYYTPSGGKIEVTLEDKGSTIEYRVTDNGIGVPKKERPNLFSKFYRAGNARKARPDGTGLGLFMAKKVVVAQGGAIIFESEEGRGSTFGFSFAKEKLSRLSEEVNRSG